MAPASSRLKFAGLLAACLALSAGCTRLSGSGALPTPMPSAAPPDAVDGAVFLPLVAHSAETGAETAGLTQAALFLPLVQRSPEPARLLIPDLEIEQSIVPVPIRDGAWDLDGLGQAVGWLETTGAGPGEALAPVLAGHVSLPSGASGPFGYLWKLRLGAEIVYEVDGQRHRYRVEDKRPLAEDAVTALYVRDGRRLLLLTCDGWDFARGVYTERLLVTAALAETP